MSGKQSPSRFIFGYSAPSTHTPLCTHTLLCTHTGAYPWSATYSVVLGKSGGRQREGEGAEEAVDTVGQQATLDSAAVDGPRRLDAGHLGGGGDVTDALHRDDDERDQVRQHRRRIEPATTGFIVRVLLFRV